MKSRLKTLFQVIYVFLQTTAIFKNIGIKNLTVQVEKEAYYMHLAGLNTKAGQVTDRNLTGSSSHASLIRAV